MCDNNRFRAHFRGGGILLQLLKKGKKCKIILSVVSSEFYKIPCCVPVIQLFVQLIYLSNPREASEGFQNCRSPTNNKIL